MDKTTRAVTVTAANFEEMVKGGGIVFLDFWASWCGPCRMFAPVFEAAAQKHPEIVFGKIDTEVEGELAAAFKVRAIPTLAVLRDGVLLFAEAGALPGPALEELIGKVKALDMAEVMKQVAPRKAAGAKATEQEAV